MGTIGTGTEGNEQAVEGPGAAAAADGAAAGDDWRSRSFEIYLKDCGQLTLRVRVKNGRIAQVDSFAGNLIGYPLKDCPREGAPIVIGDLMGGTIPDPFGVEGPVLISRVVELKDDAAADGAAKEEAGAAPAADGAEAAQDSAAAGSETPAPLVDAILQMCQLMMRVRKSGRAAFAQQFLSLAAAAEIMKGLEADPDFACSMYETINERMVKLTAKDEAQQMAALFMLHTEDDPEVVEVARQKLGDVDKQVTAIGIGRFSLTDFQKAGCPPEDLEKLRALIASAPTAAQQQEGSAAHVG